MWMGPNSGIVCGNYGYRPGSGVVHKGAWHGSCFTQSTRDKFLVLHANDPDDAMVDPDKFAEDEDALQF